MNKQVVFIGSYTPGDRTGGALGTSQILNQRNKNDIWVNTNFINNLNFNCINERGFFLLRFINWTNWKIILKLKKFYYSSNSDYKYFIFSNTIKLILSTYLFTINFFLEKNFTLFISLDDDFLLENKILVNFFKKRGNKIVTRIADDPLCSMELYDRSKSFIKKSKLLVKTILNNSDSIFVVSNGMKLKFEKNYNIKTILTYPLNNVRVGSPKIKNKKKYIFSHFGHLRINEVSNVNYFIEYLEYKKLNYEFNFIGRSKSYYNLINKNKKIRFKGWVTDEELDKIISITDFGYVPYSFDKNFQNFTQTSFPNKLTTLSKKYVPVIAHGPKNSSLNKFVDHYKIGITINELLVKNLNEQMLLLKQNIECVYQNMSKINHTIFDNKLIIKKYHKAFNE